MLILIISVHNFITGQTPSCLPKQTGVHPNKQMPGLGKHVKMLNERRHSAAVASVLFVFSLSLFFFFTACLFSLCHTHNRACTHRCTSCLLALLTRLCLTCMLSHALLPLSLWEKALGGLVGLQSSRGDKLTAAEGDWTQRGGGTHFCLFYHVSPG